MDPTTDFLPEPRSPHVVTVPSQSTWILFSLLGIFSVVVACSGVSLSCLSGLPGFPGLHLIREAIGVSFIETEQAPTGRQLGSLHRGGLGVCSLGSSLPPYSSAPQRAHRS
uniref:Uncharacterized protein n=1 Tax=Piliocolobus tephrosceles TaxID=591936 RepID=A0A8C9HYS4_9PRIM